MTQTGRPIAPARWTTAVSTQTHQIERLDDRHRVGKIVELRTEIDQRRTPPIAANLRRRRALLQ